MSELRKKASRQIIKREANSLTEIKGVSPEALQLIMLTLDRLRDVNLEIDLDIEGEGANILDYILLKAAQLRGNLTTTLPGLTLHASVTGLLFGIKKGKEVEQKVTAGITSTTVLNDPAKFSQQVLMIDQVGAETRSIKILEARGFGYSEVAKIYGTGSYLKNQQIAHWEEIRMHRGIVADRNSSDKFTYFNIREGQRVNDLFMIAGEIISPIGQAVERSLERKGLKRLQVGSVPKLT